MKRRRQLRDDDNKPASCIYCGRPIFDDEPVQETLLDGAKAHGHKGDCKK